MTNSTSSLTASSLSTAVTQLQQEQQESKDRYAKALEAQRQRQIAQLVFPFAATVEDLCTAAWNGGDIESFKNLLNLLSVDEINSTNSRGQTALYCASRKGSVEYVEALLNVPGVDVNKGDAKKSTPLHVASWEEHALVSAMLVWMGADPDIKNFYKLSPKAEARGDAIYIYPILASDGLP